MVRPISQIEQEIATLDEAIGAIAQDFETVYAHYLDDLGQVVSKQLILAAYHLCTQGYPEHFLNLSLAQRQELQHALRQLAQGASAALLAYLSPDETPDTPETDPEEDPEENLEEDSPLSGPLLELANLPDAAVDALEAAAADLEGLSAEGAIAPDLEEPGAAATPDADMEAEAEDERSPQSSLSSGRRRTGLSDAMLLEQVAKAFLIPIPSAPPREQDALDRLIHWQDRVEQGINEVLGELSSAANRLLHQADILPRSLPEPILEVAAKAGVAAEATTGAPNLMNLVIETKADDAEESGIIRLMAVRLRLSEVEFANAELAGWRSQLRTLSTRLNKVTQEYRKKQKERAIAQAEHAWRSSWFEE